MTDDELISLWRDYIADKPRHEHLLLKFYEDVVSNHPRLAEMEIVEMLRILLPNARVE